MDTRNCKMCGKLFNRVRSPFCPECTKELDEKFKQVKDYLYGNPDAGIAEVSEEVDVSQSIIQHWIREERLSFSENSKVSFSCESCGAPIQTGRFCKRCKSKMQQELQKVYAVPLQERERRKEGSAKMRFLGHDSE